MNAKEAVEAGRERGAAAGSWVLDGNSTAETARWIWEGIEDGDPEVLDIEPSPLSGEWAGESLTELGLADADDETLAAYEAGFSDGFWSEVQKAARWIVDNDQAIRVEL